MALVAEVPIMLTAISLDHQSMFEAGEWNMALISR